jgi:hypothetical protein
MNYNAFVDPKTRRIKRAAIASGSAGVVGSAHWFWWIAALSLLNGVLVRHGMAQGAALRLTVATIADNVLRASRPQAYAIEVGVGVFFLLVGWAASRGALWAFVLGAAAYALDALLSLHSASRLPILFHLLGLFIVVRGAWKLNHALTTAQIAAMEQEYEPPPQPPRDAPPHDAPPHG